MRIKETLVALLWLVTVGAGKAAAADAATNERSVSLEDCISMAIEKNLDLRVQRLNPIIAKLTLEGSYGAYDPVTAFSARQNYRTTESQVNTSLGLVERPRETYTESFGGSGVSGSLISGKLSSGTSYGLIANVARNSGTFYPNGFEYSSAVGITLSQPLLRNFSIDAERYTIQINKKNIKTSELGVRLQLMQTITRVEQTYFDLISAKENVKVQEKALELAERLLSDNTKRVQVGALAPLDQKQAESQVAASRADLIATQRARKLQENLLKGLLGDDYATWVDVTLTPSASLLALPERFSVEESWQKGLSQRPELLQAKIDLEKRDIQLKYQRNQMLPQLDVSGSYSYNGLGASFGASTADIREQKTPAYGVAATFSIPLGNRTARYNYKITKTDKEQDILRLKKLEQDIMIAVADDVALAQSSLQRVEATREARTFARDAWEAEKKKMDNGKSTNFEVLQLQREYIFRETEEIRALADYNKALAQLALNEGNTLERNKIKVEVK